MMGTGDATGSPERRAWAATEAHGTRAGKRGPDAIGGATAPLPVGAISTSTPPAQRRRVRDFASTAPDLAGQLQDMAAHMKEEFVKVWEAIQKHDDGVFDLVDQGTLDSMQIALDKRLELSNGHFKDLYKKLNDLDASHEKITENLGKFEKELIAWTAGSDTTARALADVQALVIL